MEIMVIDNSYRLVAPVIT